jgi:acyl carrier protein
MTEEKIRATIALVAQALDISENELGPDSSMENVPAWDSEEHMNICLAFEQRFGRKLDMDAIVIATNIRTLATLVP